MYEVALVYVLVFVVCIRCDIFVVFCRVIIVGRKCTIIFNNYDFHTRKYTRLHYYDHTYENHNC